MDGSYRSDDAVGFDSGFQRPPVTKTLPSGSNTAVCSPLGCTMTPAVVERGAGVWIRATATGTGVGVVMGEAVGTGVGISEVVGAGVAVAAGTRVEVGAAITIATGVEIGLAVSETSVGIAGSLGKAVGSGVGAVMVSGVGTAVAGTSNGVTVGVGVGESPHATISVPSKVSELATNHRLKTIAFLKQRLTNRA